MRKYILFFIFSLSIISFGKIKIKVKPLTFKEVRAQNNGLYKNKATARGVILIETDDLEKDAGKLIEFEVPKYINLSNGKRWIKTKDITFKDEDQEIIITEKNHKVIYHVSIDKRELANESNKEKIEGTYTGDFNLNYSIYDKEM